MPGGNRMGPMGQGPMTGRASGYCAGYDAPGFLNAPFARAGGGGRPWGACGGGGGGWRHRHWYYATGLPGWSRGGMGWPGWGRSFLPAPSKEAELAGLKQQATGFEQALNELKARIQELEKPDDTSSVRS